MAGGLDWESKGAYEGSEQRFDGLSKSLLPSIEQLVLHYKATSKQLILITTKLTNPIC